MVRARLYAGLSLLSPFLWYLSGAVGGSPVLPLTIYGLSVGAAGGSVVGCWRHRNGAGAEWARLGLVSGIFWLVALLATLVAFLTGSGSEFLAVLNSSGEWLSRLEPGVVAIDFGVLVGVGGVVGACLVGLAVLVPLGHRPMRNEVAEWLGEGVEILTVLLWAATGVWAFYILARVVPPSPYRGVATLGVLLVGIPLALGAPALVGWILRQVWRTLRAECEAPYEASEAAGPEGGSSLPADSEVRSATEGSMDPGVLGGHQPSTKVGARQRSNLPKVAVTSANPH